MPYFLLKLILTVIAAKFSFKVWNTPLEKNFAGVWNAVLDAVTVGLLWALVLTAWAL